MNESLLQRVLKLLEVIESPVILHSEATMHPAEELASLRTRDVLRPPSRADRIPRPKRFGPGPDVDVYDSPTGLVGVVEDDDYHYEPISLSDDDALQYEVSLQHFIARIREENCIEGSGFRNDNGLISVGQKSVDDVGVVDVYLSLPNSSEDVVIARCRRLTGVPSGRRVALLTPGVLEISTEGRSILASSGIVTIALVAVANKGHLAVNWNETFGCREFAVGTPALAGTTGVEPLERERLIEGKEHVGISTAARYLQRTNGHVGRLVRTGKLTRVGQGRPMKVSTKSIRQYQKGT